MKIRTLVETFLPILYKRRIYKNQRTTNLDSLSDNRILEPELISLNQFIKKDDICFDVGANNGEYLYQLSRKVPEKNIYAFEPIPDLFQRLKRLFRKINIHRIAMSNQNTSSSFKIPVVKDQVMKSRGKLDTDIIEPEENGFELIKVTCMKLDDFCRENKIAKIDFIKIDVEGHEYSVLKGANSMIQKCLPTMLIEIEQRHHNFPIDEIFVYLKNFGYDIKFYSIVSGEFASIDCFSVDDNQKYEDIKSKDYINNFWCFPPEANFRTKS